MSNGQARVLVLLLILLGLEILRMPALKTWFSGAWSAIGSAIGANKPATETTGPTYTGIGA